MQDGFDFMTNSEIDTFMIELRIGRRLLAVSVLDHVADGLSAVYTFYDPTEHRRSPGTLAILRPGSSGGRRRTST